MVSAGTNALCTARWSHNWSQDIPTRDGTGVIRNENVYPNKMRMRTQNPDKELIRRELLTQPMEFDEVLVRVLGLEPEPNL